MDAEKIEAAITKRTKAILVTHLYGQAADMGKISALAKAYGLHLLEDCAQSHGARFCGQMTGTFGDVGCFSFYPTKNLGAFGDAGAIVTNDPDIARTVRMLRNYGSEVKYHNEMEGANSRLDEIQAALLRVKLSHLAELNDERARIAQRYLQGIHHPAILLPPPREHANHVYHQFVIRTKHRDAFQAYLKEHGIATIIHYPIPPHLAKCYESLGYHAGDFPIAETYANEVLSLPIYNGMTEAEQQYVIDIVNAYPEEAHAKDMSAGGVEK